MDLDRAYAECAQVTRREARNFYFAFLSLPRHQRRAVYALYAFCREADDVADSSNPLTPRRGHVVGEQSPNSRHGAGNRTLSAVDSSSPPTEKRDETALLGGRGLIELKRAELRRLRERLVAAGEGRAETLRDEALADAIDRFGVRIEDLDAVIDGVEMDLEPVRVETEEELEAYCYRVASAVGLATLPILTDAVPPTDAMREMAVRLGFGMQYVNILRDVDEDLRQGRVYLPTSAFARHGLKPEILEEREVGKALLDLFHEHGDRAHEHLSAGLDLLYFVPRTARPCLWLLAEIYGRILRRIEASGYDVFAGRISLPTYEKLGLLAAALGRRW